MEGLGRHENDRPPNEEKWNTILAAFERFQLRSSHRYMSPKLSRLHLKHPNTPPAAPSSPSHTQNPRLIPPIHSPATPAPPYKPAVEAVPRIPSPERSNTNLENAEPTSTTEKTKAKPAFALPTPAESTVQADTVTVEKGEGVQSNYTTENRNASRAEDVPSPSKSTSPCKGVSTQGSRPGSVPPAGIRQPDAQQIDLQKKELRETDVQQIYEEHVKEEDLSDSSDEVVFQKRRNSTLNSPENNNPTTAMRLTGDNLALVRFDQRSVAEYTEEIQSPSPTTRVLKNPIRTGTGHHETHTAVALNPSPMYRTPTRTGWNMPANRPNWNQQTRVPVTPPKTNDPKKGGNIKKELARLQKEAINKIGLRAHGVDPDAPPKSRPLHLARQGDGTDPRSDFSRGVALIIADPAAYFNLPPPIPREPVDKEETENNNISNADHHAGKQLILRSIPADWEYRPWELSHSKTFTKFMLKWLDDTVSACVATRDGPLDGLNETEHPVTCLDMTDAESAAHFHETSMGYMYNWQTRLRHEQEAKQTQLVRMDMESMPASPSALTLHAPEEKVLTYYLRPIEPKDLPGLLALLNWYVQHTTRCVDLQQVTLETIRDRIQECNQEKFPTLVALQQKSTGAAHAMNGQNEEIYGYIIASDFTAPDTINSYTAELELFVAPPYYRMGVATCLLDKILEILDPKYVHKPGYHFDCAPSQADVYRAGKNRPVSRLVFIIHHPADEGGDGDYGWTKEWLETQFGFEEQALLKGTGFKDGKW
ncbi:hypothetical protein FQN50_003966 [Emmonsiellopsis sp. PD_5]|nr:hypothetical protein FQN50_003966 [Emmonsiellopsis sp. PD_5]